MEARFDAGRSGFPEILSGRCRCLSCLKAQDHTALYLAELTDTGQRVIVRTADDDESIRLLRNEAQLLEKIAASDRPEAAAFPKLIGRLPDGDGEILIRDYIPGQSLETLVESRPDRPGMPREAALDCAASVAALLVFLHRLDPPVIHRDIKPQNVIVDPQGACHLIDLGISRLHTEDGDTDTRVMGTRLTAPPEQFGYRQTDERSDIYSAGVLLRYCLTGEYAENADAQLDADLARVVRRATRFDPNLRYQRSEDLLRALRRLRRLTPKRRRRAHVAALAAALALVTALAALAVLALRGVPGRYDLRGAYHFREPLIESAVRRQLGVPDRALTAEDLAKVTGLHIFGGLIYDDDSQLQFLGEYTMPWQGDALGEGWRENGGIRSLDDVRQLPNLTALSLYRQSIGDISALKDTRIAALGLGFNPIADLSPLEGNAAVTALNITCLKLEDLSVPASLPNLSTLELSGTAVDDLSPIAHLPLKRLNLVNVPLTSYAALERMTGLESLSVNKLLEPMVDALSGLSLRELEVTGEERLSPRALEALDDLRRLEFRAAETMELDSAPLSFPALEMLDLRGVRCESLECLSGLGQLATLSISESAFDRFDGLDGLQRLERIVCTEAQADALRARYPDRDWTLSH